MRASKSLRSPPRGQIMSSTQMDADTDTMPPPELKELNVIRAIGGEHATNRVMHALEHQRELDAGSKETPRCFAANNRSLSGEGTNRHWRPSQRIKTRERPPTGEVPWITSGAGAPDTLLQSLEVRRPKLHLVRPAKLTLWQPVLRMQPFTRGKTCQFRVWRSAPLASQLK